MRQTVASGVTFAHKSAKLSKSLDIRLKFNGIRQKLRIYCKNHINISRLSAPSGGKRHDFMGWGISRRRHIVLKFYEKYAIPCKTQYNARFVTRVAARRCCWKASIIWPKSNLSDFLLVFIVFFCVFFAKVSFRVGDNDATHVVAAQAWQKKALGRGETFRSPPVV